VNEAEEIEQLDELAEEVSITRLAPAPGSLPGTRSPGGAVPVRAAAVAAAGSFMAGAAVVGIISRRQRRSSALVKARPRARILPRPRRSSRPTPAAGERLQIVGTRKLLLDVHLLGSPGPDS
jgi:hypothetical protein